MSRIAAKCKLLFLQACVVSVRAAGLRVRRSPNESAERVRHRLVLRIRSMMSVAAPPGLSAPSAVSDGAFRLVGFVWGNLPGRAVSGVPGRVPQAVRARGSGSGA
jgi:hypothetical protein